MRQSVGLTGLGLDMFRRANENIAVIHTLFSRAVKEGVLEPRPPESYNDKEAINCSNRYFTSRYHNRSAVQIPFNNKVDPNGILAGLSNDHLVHDEENVVEFLELQDENLGGSKV